MPTHRLPANHLCLDGQNFKENMAPALIGPRFLAIFWIANYFDLQRVRKCPITHQTPKDNTMEAERINLIGNSLQDLTERTRELRGYL